MAELHTTLDLVRLFSRMARFVAMYGEDHQQPRLVLEEFRKLLDDTFRESDKISFALQGEALMVQGIFQPIQDDSVHTLAGTMRVHAVTSLSFLAGVTDEDLFWAAKLFAAKPVEVRDGEALKPEFLRGRERVKINDIKYVAVSETQAVVDAGVPLALDPKSGLPLLPPEFLAALKDAGASGAAERVASALGLGTGTDAEAARQAFRGLAPNAGDALSLVEALSRALPSAGGRIPLESLERLMRFLPDVDRLGDILHGDVLVASGDAERRAAYQKALADYGYRVETAESAAQAMEKAIRHGALVALVTDLDLPDKSCDVILSRLRQARMIVPVVIVSPKAAAATHDFEIFAYPKKKLLASEKPEAVAEAVREIAVKRAPVEDEAEKADRERAREIQERLIPRELPQLPGWELACAYAPAKNVGGDYLDVFPLDAERVGFAVGDVSGKGYSAALVMVMIRSAFRLAATGFASPRQAAVHVNRLVRPDMRRGMFVSLIYAVLHTPTGRLTLVNCGHNPPALWLPGGKARLLDAGGMPLGIADTERFEPGQREETIDLPPRGCAVLYTDGVVEAMNSREDEFGEKRFLDVLSVTAGAGAQTLVDATTAALAAHRGAAAQSDDITLLALRRVPD